MSRAAYTFVDLKSKKIADIVEFDLIDNPGTRAWQCAVMLNDSKRTLYKVSSLSYQKTLPANIEIQYNDLKFTLRKLAHTQFAWNQDIPETFDRVTQDFMNRLHRHFTASCYALWDHRFINNYEQELNQTLQTLNDQIHSLECYIATDHKIKYNQISQEVWALNNGAELGYDIFPFRQYHSYEPADLILDAYILGKTLLESFSCHDDPSSWDTAGHMRTNGGAVMILNQGRSQIYNSFEFSQWLLQHSLEKNKKMADFPLGNFVSGHRNKMDFLSKNLSNYSVELSILL